LKVLRKWGKSLKEYEDENNQMRLVKSVELLHEKFYGKRTHSQAFPQKEQERFRPKDKVEAEWSETEDGDGDDRWYPAEILAVDAVSCTIKWEFDGSTTMLLKQKVRLVSDVESNIAVEVYLDDVGSWVRGETREVRADDADVMVNGEVKKVLRPNIRIPEEVRRRSRSKSNPERNVNNQDASPEKSERRMPRYERPASYQRRDSDNSENRSNASPGPRDFSPENPSSERHKNHYERSVSQKSGRSRRKYERPSGSRANLNDDQSNYQRSRSERSGGRGRERSARRNRSNLEQKQNDNNIRSASRKHDHYSASPSPLPQQRNMQRQYRPPSYASRPRRVPPPKKKRNPFQPPPSRPQRPANSDDSDSEPNIRLSEHRI